MVKNERKSAGHIRSIIGSVLKCNRSLSAGLVLAVAGSVAAGLIPPLVLERIVDRLTEGRMTDAALIALYIAMLAASGVFDTVKESFITVFGQKVTHAVRSRMCQKLTGMPAAYFSDNDTGVITSRFVNDVDAVEALFDSGVISMAADGCEVIGVLVMIFFISPGLGIMMLFVTPLLMCFTIFVQKRMLAAQIDNRAAVGRANNHVPETVNNIRMIHNMCAGKFMKKRYGKYLDEGFSAMERSNFHDAVYSPVIITVSAVMVSVMMIFAAMGGGMRAFFGISAGSAVAVISYVSKVFEPLESIGMEIQNIQSAIAGIYRIDEFLSENERRPAVSGADVKSADSENSENSEDSENSVPAIDFENVTFGYKKGIRVLDGFSFTVPEGGKAILAGRTGAGKSTAFKLVLGLYEPWAGEIRICGVPVGDIPDSERAALIGYVEQTFHIIEGTVRDQITLKDPEVSDGEVMKALELTGMSDVVGSLEHGMDTVCSQALFSQGQHQLLSIARAVVHDPRILMLDEITANLDSVTERRVLDALERASDGRTVLSISHRIYDGTGGGQKVIFVD